jgi:hypothetical protein
MAEESSSPARLDTLTKHVSEYRSPLSLLSQFFFDLLDLFEQMIATDEVLLKYPGVDAAAMHLAKDLVKCLSTLNSALQRCVDSKVVISQSFKDHAMFILQIMHLFSIETLENLTSSRVTISFVTC